MRQRLPLRTPRSGALLAAGLACCLAPSAHASPPSGDDPPPERPSSAAVHPGAQARPPGPPPPSSAPLEPDADRRRHIRGCPVGSTCGADPRDDLRVFEREAFGGGSPWLPDDDPDGHAAIRRGGATLGAPGGARPRTAADPLALRPDLAWLGKLQRPDLPFSWSTRIIDYLVYYKDNPRGRRLMRSWLRDQGRYRQMLERALRRAGLPVDLLYVAMIESSYDPGTRSRVGAAGLWQFMPAGAKIYGLTVSRWLDERYDPVRSTEAVVMYWADLYQRFGDWELALAAYNAGYGAVLRGIATFNTNDFWTLVEYENALPWESSIYVPKALAAAIVGRNRALFGYDDIPVEPALTWQTVTVPTSVSLSAIARACGVKVDAIRELNPQLPRGRTPPGVNRYVVRVPDGTAGLFAERFPQLRGDWDRYDAYVVAHGQRFEDIATMHGISRYRLRKLNGVEHESEVVGGTVLVVPRVSEADKRKNMDKAQASLYTSGVPESRDGEPLLVAVPDADLEVAGKRRVFYRVVTGDTLWGVSRALGVRVRDLAAWNGLDADAHLHPRMVLMAFVDRKLDARAANVALLDPARLLVVTRGSDEHIAETELRRGRERVVYSPRRRESYAQIGKKFGLTARDVARINRKSPRTVVEAGDEVIVYQVVDTSRSDRARRQARKAPRRRTRAKTTAKSRARPRARSRAKQSARPREPDGGADGARPAARTASRDDADKADAGATEDDDTAEARGEDDDEAAGDEADDTSSARPEGAKNGPDEADAEQGRDQPGHTPAGP